MGPNRLNMKPVVFGYPYLTRKYDQQKFDIYIKHKKCAHNVGAVLRYTNENKIQPDRVKYKLKINLYLYYRNV